MAYDSSELALIGSANGYSTYRYDTEDAHATVDTDGYFSGDAVNMLRVGDVIDVFVWATAIRTGTVSTYGRHVVMTNDGTDVGVSNVTTGTVTDTD